MFLMRKRKAVLEKLSGSSRVLVLLLKIQNFVELHQQTRLPMTVMNKYRNKITTIMT